MDPARYSFSNFIEDDTLSILAVQAKELLQNENIVKIFQINNELLYGHSPRQALFLMKQNNKAIFLSSPTKENSPSDSKSCQELSTPIAGNPDVSNMPRRYLPFVHAEKQDYWISKLDTGTPVRRRPLIFNSNLHPTIEEHPIDEQFTSPFGSTGSPEVGKESPRSAEISTMTMRLTRAEKELESPTKVISDINEGKQESPRSTEIIRMTSSLSVDDKKFRSLIQDDPMKGNYIKNADDSEEKSEISDNIYLGNKDNFRRVEEMITGSTITRSEITSPLKRSQMCISPAYSIQKFASPSENATPVNISPEYMGKLDTCISGDKSNTSLKKAGEIILKDPKRKSVNPKKKNHSLFKSIPRVIQLAERTETDIEVCTHLEDDSIPQSSQNLSADFKCNSLQVGIKSPVLGESKSDTSSITLKKYLCHSDDATSISSSRNFSTKNSAGNIDFDKKHSSGNLSMDETTTRDHFFESESVSSHIETDHLLFKHKILKFYTLFALREQVLEKMFCTLLIFQNGIQYLISYAQNVSDTVVKISLSNKTYTTNEFKDIANDVCALALSLTNKLSLWKTNADFDVINWKKFLQEIKTLKAEYEPLLSNDGKPAVDFEVAQVYENEVKAIWKKMDDIVIMGDSRRALFSQIAHDFEKLIQMFVECLIIVGILLPR